MTECTKSLHQTVKTLRKNPERTRQLVKVAGERLKDSAVTAGAAASTGIVGAALTRDLKKGRITSRIGTKGAYKHMTDSSIEGAEKRLARSGKILSRMSKPLRKATMKGGLAGAALGAGLGVANMKKEAGVPAVVPKQEFLGKGGIPAGAKDVSRKSVAMAKAKKLGKIGMGIAAAGTLAVAAKNRMEKKAEDSSSKTAVKGAVTGGLAAGAYRVGKDSVTAIKGLNKQIAHMASKGHLPSPIEAKMAINTFNKPMKNRALKAAGNGAAVGALAALAIKKFRGHDKKAAELIHHKGEKYRRGTIQSAAGKMAATEGALGALMGGKLLGARGAVLGGISGAGGGAVHGSLYGLARHVLRSQDGEKSMSPAKFDALKAKKR